MLTQALAGLRDVDEVQGSFLLADDGRLLARDLPAVFHADIFAEVGPRLARLRETFDAESGPSALTMRFTDHKLHVRGVGSKLLCVLTGAAVNGPALRMAMNLVARRIESHGDEPQAWELAPDRASTAPLSAAPRSAAPSSSAPPTSAPPTSAPPTTRGFQYRGHKV